MYVLRNLGIVTVSIFLTATMLSALSAATLSNMTKIDLGSKPTQTSSERGRRWLEERWGLEKDLAELQCPRFRQVGEFEVYFCPPRRIF